jgi:transcriptional regulator with XRE-family HTH domain
MNATDNTDNKAIAKRLKQVRTEKNLSARKFALRAGIDPSQYLKVESGLLPLGDKLVQKIVAAYPGVEKNYLLTGGSAALDKPQKPATPLLPLKHIKDTVSVADALIRIMPPLKPHLPAEEQLALHAEREQKYEMAFSLARKAINDLMDRL